MADESNILVRLRLLGASVFSADAQKAAASLDTVGAGGKRAAGGLAATAHEATRAEAAVARMHRVMGKTSSVLGSVYTGARSVVAPLATLGGVAVAGGIYGAAKSTISLDAAMRNVNSIAGLSEKSLGRLSKQITNLGGDTAQQPVTLAEGLYDLVSSGFNATQSLKILQSTSKAATAGLTDTATSTHAVAAVLNAYHLKARDAARVSDTLFQTVNRGVVSFPQLATSIGDVLPFAASLHIGLGQVGAAVSTMTKEGINAPETMTRLKQVMETFLKPSMAVTKALSDLGVESGEQLIKQKGLQGALEAVISTTDGSKAAVAQLFPNIRALGGALALTGRNAKTAHADIKGFGNVKGLTDNALHEQSKSLTYQWHKLKAEASGIGIALGKKVVPAASALLRDVNGLVKHGGAVSELIAGLGGHAPKVRVASGSSQHGLGADAASPAHAVSSARTTGLKIRSVIGDTIGKIGSIVSNAIPAIAGVAKEILDAFKPAAPFLKNVLLPLLTGVAKGVIGSVVAAFKVAIPIVKAAATALGFLGNLARPLKGLFQGIGAVVGFVFGGPILKAIGSVGKFGRVFRLLSAPVRIVGKGVGLTGSALAVLGRAFARAVTFAGRFAGTFTGPVRSAVLAIINPLQSVIRVVGKMVGFISDKVGKVGGIFKNAFGGLAAFVGGIFDKVVGVIQSAIHTATNIINDLIIGFNKLPGPNIGLIGITAKGTAGAKLGTGSVTPGGGVRSAFSTHATGGVIRTPFALVGERGPELIRAPGYTVTPAAATARMARAGAPMAAPAMRLHATIPITLRTAAGRVFHSEVMEYDQILQEAR